MRLILRCGIVFLAFVGLLRAEESEPRGRLWENVVCAADAEQSYALYVPSYYTKEKLWPVIYCFDPGARGRTPVERFRAAAEKFGYIVAGSNNSRNGPWEANEQAIQAMTTDVAAHFSIDRKRIYTAGLSGGARVAVQIALGGYAKGVIACSAGFPTPSEEMPSRVAFPFFGTAGTEDFNYREMKQLDSDLDARKAAHRIVIFDGGHEWAPAELLTSAVEWLEVQAMRTGTRPRDDALIQGSWQTRLSAVPKTEGLDRWRELKSLAADFKDLTATTSVESEARKLGNAAKVKEAVKAERKLIAREAALLLQLGDAADRNAATRHKIGSEVRAKADAAEDSAERQMVRRVVASFFYIVRDETRGQFANREYSQAAKLLELAAELRPGQSRTWFDLARARAYSSDAKGAVDALRQAAAAGFSDATRAEADPAFAKLSAENEFREILATIRANPPEPERGPGEGRARFR